MARPTLAFMLLPLLFCPLGHPQGPPAPRLDGYVSRVDNPTRFEVNGRPVQLSERAEHSCAEVRSRQPELVGSDIGLADHVLIFGKYDRKQGAIAATAVCRLAWTQHKVSGAAVLERTEGKRLLVDGRLLEINPETTIKAMPPRTGLADAQVGDWVSYTAVAEADGRVVAKELTIAPNTVSKAGAGMRPHQIKFTPPDPASGKAGEVQFFHLAKRYSLPADGAVAERLTRVGKSVVPAWQKALTTDDPLRIDFHFYEIEKFKLKACLSSVNGNIFVSTETFGRLSSDDELAAVLATCVADLIEKQEEFLEPQLKGASGAALAGLAAGLIVPGAGIATAVGSSVYGEHLVERLREQSERVSLDLLAAAGYQPGVAASAWDKVEVNRLPIKPGSEPPQRVAALYRALAERQRRSD